MVGPAKKKEPKLRSSVPQKRKGRGGQNEGRKRPATIFSSDLKGIKVPLGRAGGKVGKRRKVHPRKKNEVAVACPPPRDQKKKGGKCGTPGDRSAHESGKKRNASSCRWRPYGQKKLRREGRKRSLSGADGRGYTDLVGRRH